MTDPTPTPGRPDRPGPPRAPEATPVVDVDAAILDGEEPPSARRPLDRDRIVTAALDFIDAHGLGSLSMRRLGGVLGVEAMALYRYVPGKEELLDAVVDRLAEGMDDDEAVLRMPEHGWQDFLQRLAHGVRRVALSHPRAFPLVASRPPEAPWLRPPLRNLDWVETFLRGLVEEGFEDAEAVAGYRAFTSFLLGHLLLEVSAHGADVGPLDVLEDVEPVDARGYPLVDRMGAALAEDHAATEFEEALETLLERIALMHLEHGRD